ncbi:hypothetical protein CERSUDRAFT_115829 [Gelatoporia subvermispora B]|uniref:F-box domain-containing protein n=1 Tax=Ceriporiopsis subvermispora (strain B) TaxID=914234 RepID=M2RC29_CERS8|nr:hypothetical protein CERSUDRAFT_115829 [Gelatoporia subvermispora B]
MRFMLNNPTYFKYLRTLDLRFDDLSLARTAAQVITRCYWLEELFVLLSGREFLDVPELDEAICSLPRLKRLWVIGDVATDRFARCMTRMTCQLRTFNTDFTEGTSQEAVAALHSSSDHLEVVCACGLSFRNIGQPLSRVRWAGIKFVDFNYDTSILLHWFPALKSLWFSESRLGDASRSDLSLWDEVRRRNESRRSTSRWPQLETISGHFLSIYSAAPTCRIHNLECNDVTMHCVERLSVLLTDLRPRAFDLHVVLNPQQCYLLSGLLQQASSVIQFTIRIEFEFNQYTTNLAEELTNHLPRALQPLGLRSIKVAFALHGLTDNLDDVLRAGAQGTEELDDDELEVLSLARAIHTLDAHHLARKIAEQVTSLTHVIIQLPGDEPDAAWDISRSDCDGLYLIPSAQSSDDEL